MPLSGLTSDDASTAGDLERRILDAALIQFERVGVKKTTIEDVARQAEVDRVTVYRRIGSREDLVRAVVAREIQILLAELADIAPRHDNAENEGTCLPGCSPAAKRNELSAGRFQLFLDVFATNGVGIC